MTPFPPPLSRFFTKRMTPLQSVTSFMTYQISSIVEEHVRLKLDPGRVVVEHQVAAGIANLSRTFSINFFCKFTFPYLIFNSQVFLFVIALSQGFSTFFIFVPLELVVYFYSINFLFWYTPNTIICKSLYYNLRTH